MVGKFSRGATRVHVWLIQVVVERYRISLESRFNTCWPLKYHEMSNSSMNHNIYHGMVLKVVCSEKMIRADIVA